jgi:hypothetical protein
MVYFLFTGRSDKMLFQVMKNENVVIAVHAITATSDRLW